MLRDKFRQLLRRRASKKAKKAPQVRRRVGVESLENRHLMAVMLGWDFSGIASGDFGSSPRSPSTTSANISTVVGLTRGAGLLTSNPVNADGRGFGAVDFNSADLAAATSASDFVSFGFTVPSQTRVSLNSLDYSLVRSALGGSVSKAQWQYSVNSGAFVNLGTDVFLPSTASTTTLDLSTTTALQSMNAGTTVSFRVAVYGATSGSTEFYLFDVSNSSANDLVLNGTAITTPVVASPSATSVTGTGATLNGNLTSDGGATATARGFVYAKTSVNANPQIGGTGVTNVVVGSGTGTFSSVLSGLDPATSYSFVAYGTNTVGTQYSTPVSTFTTLQLAPTVTSPTATSITSSAATLGGNVTLSNGATVTARGVVYAKTSVNSNPQIGGTGVTVVNAGSGTGVFTTNITGLDLATGYSFVAFATNSIGTTYTTPVSTFTTLALAPVVSTPTSASVTSSSATLGGNVVTENGATVTARGIVYAKTSVNSNPQIGGTGVTVVNVGTGPGVFTTNITGLDFATGYSFVAFATNSIGTTYTTPVSTFNTLAIAPTIDTPTVNNVLGASAVLGGNVALENGSPVTARGIVYAKTTDNPNPQIGGAGVTVVNVGSGTGTFSTTVTGLSQLTGYSFAAFATNGIGTSYTSPVGTFNTLALPAVTSIVVNDGVAFANTAQRSQVVNLKVTFSTSVTLNPGVFSIANIDPATAATLASSGAGNQIYVNGSLFNSNVTGTVFTITFGSGVGVATRAGGTAGGVTGNSLSDGNFQLTIDKTKVTDSNSGNLESDRLFGNVMTDRFFRLFGDSDGDGDVDATDNNNFRRAQTTYNAALDLEGDSSVGASDATAFRTNLNKRRRSF